MAERTRPNPRGGKKPRQSGVRSAELRPLFVVSISGERFAWVKPVAESLSGRHVRYKGWNYPAEEGYPLNVLIAQLSSPGQVVLFEAEDQGELFGVFSGTDRVVRLDLSRSDQETLDADTRRLCLASSSDPLRIDKPADGFRWVNIKKVTRPKVIDPRFVKRLVGASFASLVISCLAVWGSFSVGEEVLLEAKKAEQEAVQQLVAKKRRHAELRDQIAALDEVRVAAENEGVRLPPVRHFYSDAIQFGLQSVKIRGGELAN